MNMEDEELVKMFNLTLKGRETILFFLIVVINGLIWIESDIGLDTCAMGRWMVEVSRMFSWQGNVFFLVEEFCLLLQSSVPHPASHNIYFVILEISPKDNRLSISILSIQKYSLDEDIDFLYCAEMNQRKQWRQRKERKTILFYLKKEKQKLGL